MAKTKSEALPAVLGDYAISMMNSGEVAEIIKENIGNSTIGQFDLDRIKVPAGGATVWSVPTLEGDEPAKELLGVIVHFQDQRAYWAESFGKGGGGSPPDCSSLDMQVGVGNPGGDCSRCPFAQFGSAVRDDGSEGRGQACRSIRALYVLLPNSVLPLVVPIPPSSLKPVRSYFLRLSSQAVPYHKVITRLKLARTKSGDGIDYAQVQVEMAQRLTDADHARILPLKKMIQAAAQTIDSRDYEAAA